MSRKYRTYNTLNSVVLLALLFACVFGCAKPPTTYTMPPDEVEAFRSNIHKVAVADLNYLAVPHADLPAKGILAAAGRGFVSGAGMTIAAGVVSPVPGGTIFGVILSPVGGVVGSVHGMVNAEDSDKVEAVEAALDEAGDRLKDKHLSKMFLDRVMELGRDQTDYEFVLAQGFGPKSLEDMPLYTSAEVDGADHVLEVRPLRAGLWGLWTVNPPSSPFIEIRVRLIRVSDNAVLVDDIIMCAGEERSYDQWADNDGQLFIDEIVKTVPRLAEKVIDDTFRVYALSRRRG